MGAPRHSGLVRVTHWITAVNFIALLVSGVAILLAHPRLYWGETGAAGGDSLLDLPLPLILAGQSGWGRYLHFLAAWVCVLTGSIYVAGGVLRRHFAEGMLVYEPLQRRTYLFVIFGLFPVMIWTGLAMSPAVTSVFPAMVDMLGGQQSARTIHFFTAAALTVFLLRHVAMAGRAGFLARVGAMITGGKHERFTAEVD
jgi:thiosulfate reductase cytochrome b subunit